MTEAVQSFLAAKTFAVAGASTDRSKYGNMIFRRLIDTGHKTYPLNPKADLVEGHTAFAQLSECPVPPEALSIITPPAVTRGIVQDAILAGVKHLWMQPGAEDEQASADARNAGLNVIDDGSCLLVLLAR